MKKVMIIQPMTGKTYEQLKTEWDKAYNELTDMGYRVTNTHFRGLKPANYNAALYRLSEDYATMSDSDGLLFLPGWREDMFCCVQRVTAEACGKPIFDSTDELRK